MKNDSLSTDRNVCYRCRKAQVMCYCAAVVPFTSDPEFVILIHPKETRKAINTGRMAFLGLKNAQMIVDHDFTDNKILNALLADSSKRCYLLFPGAEALDIADLPRSDARNANRSIVRDVFLILDATWTMAKKMLRLSSNLQSLPLVMFEPPHPSRFLIREQPGVICFSTIETIHHIIEMRGGHPGREHDRLLTIFDDMVQKQMEYERESRAQLADRHALSLRPEL